MKLPDFTKDVDLNELRRKMNAELHPYSPPTGRTPLTAEEVQILATKGIEIPLRDIGILNDGTFTYKGKRVAVYIRDVASYQNQYSLPKFHLAMCETLLTMRDEGRYEKRYVVATRDDGQFRIQRIEGNRVVSKTDEVLDVCQNCLHGLHYKNFNKNRPRHEKENFIRNFSIRHFFEENERSPLWAQPHYDSNHAPSNVYSVDFYEIAMRIKEQHRFRCEEPTCRRDLSSPLHRKFLHAHHKNADKTDNRPSNISLLCIHCHAKAFQHSHVRQMPDYREFCELFHLNI